MRFIILFCCLILIYAFCYSQVISTPVLMNDSIFQTDQKLVRFKINVQKNWNFKFKNSKMIISCKDSIWLMYINAAGISIVDTTEWKFNDSTYLMNHGKRMLPEMTFYFVSKWDRKMKQDALKFNNNIYSQVAKLKQKYHLENIKEWQKWGQSGFIGATIKEEERIKEYQNEKKNLEAQNIMIPKFSSSKFSIFIESQNWLHELPYFIAKFYPKEEVESIDQMLEDLLQPHGEGEE